jgi:probable rRNA maturation factor
VNVTGVKAGTRASRATTDTEPMLELALSYGCGRLGLPARRSFARWGSAALSAARVEGSFQLCLRVVDEVEGLALNRDYRGKDYATNVLSFPGDAGAPHPHPRLLGDVAMCAPVIAREAREQGKSTSEHFAHLTVHGVLHLLGYDHDDDASASTMEALEIQALAACAITNPYEPRS